MWRCAIPNIQPYMSRLILEFVSSTKIYRVIQYKTLIVRFLCRFSLSDKSERSIELIKRYMDDKSPRKNVVSRAFDVLQTGSFLKGTGCLGLIGVSSIDGFDVYLDTSVVQDSADGFP